MPNRKKYKISPLELKSLGITAGVNASNANQLKKISKLKIKKEIPKVPLSDLYMHVKGQWIHKGKSCRLCGLLLSDTRVIDKHQYICKVLNKKETEED